MEWRTGTRGSRGYIRVLAVPILLGWMLLTVVTNVAVPSLEKVGEDRTVGLSCQGRAGLHLDEADRCQLPGVRLRQHRDDRAGGGPAARRRGAPLLRQLVNKLEADTAHVQHVADFWGDPLTASGAQSADGKAAYVQLYLHGNQGEPLANESVAAVREHRRHDAAAAGDENIRHRRGAADRRPAPRRRQEHLQSHAHHDRRHRRHAAAGLPVDRHDALILVHGVHRARRRPRHRRVPGYNEIIGLSTFAMSLLTLMVIAAGTDYAIFPIGRYQEARGAGEDREAAYYTMFHGTAHVILGSGLTIAGAMLCLSFTRLPYFQTMGVPCAVGTLVAVLAAMTLGPAVVVVGSRFGLFEPKRADQFPRLAADRDHGGAVARPGPGGDAGAGARRPGRTAGLQDQLRRAQVPARRTSPPTSATRRPTAISARRG